MKKFNLLSVISVLILSVVPLWAQGPLADIKCKTATGEYIYLTDNVNVENMNKLNGEIDGNLKKSVEDHTMSELDSFKLKKSIDKLFNSGNKRVNHRNLEEIKNIISSYPNSEELVNLEKDVEKVLAIKGDYSSVEGLKDKELRNKLGDLVREHKNLGYRGARLVMFKELDNVNGYVTGVYTGRKVKTDKIPSAVGEQSMNTEHTWPKSKGAKDEPAKSDIFHLFPTDSHANSVRWHLPFGIVTDPTWEEGGSKCDGDVFMPRACHRGNVARAIFYFSIVYKLRVPDDEEAVLKQWNKDDPVDEAEKKRNEGICKYQGNRNPFIDRPDFIDKISNF